MKQVKVLRDKEKLDVATGEKQASGLGFVEFEEPELALFAVRYLNNMELVEGKGLIVDFSLEDARALKKRGARMDKWKKGQEEREREKKIEKKQEQKKEVVGKNGVVELGKKKEEKAGESRRKKKEKGPSISEITDVETLNRLYKNSHSRGKRQRIKKRLQLLEHPAQQPA